MANYSYVIDSHYKPYSLQELLVPYMIYKDAYDKMEERAIELKNKTNVFKYLSETLPQDSKARQIYENYANDLAEQASALNHHGLTMGIRGGITDLRSRYEGEIGRLNRAKTTLDKINQLRLEQSAKDPTMIYATNNYGIDDFLDEKTPNLYGISGHDLYQKGMIAGAANAKSQNSAADVGTMIQGLYNDFVTSTGYDPNDLYAFRENISRIPELAQAVDSILIANGVYDNIKDPAGLMKAKTNVINGLIDGALGTREVKHSLQRNGTPDQKQLHDMMMDEANLELNKMKFLMDTAIRANAADAEAVKALAELKGKADRVNIVPMRSQKEMDDAAEYSQYFTEDGNGSFKLNQAGVEALYAGKKSYDNTVVSGPGGPVATFKPDNFYTFMKSISGKDPIIDNNTYARGLGNAWKNFQEGKFYDIDRSSEIIIDINQNQGTALKKAVFRRHNSVKEYSTSGKGYQVGDDLKQDELKDFIPTSVGMDSKKKISITWQDETNGITKITEFPYDVNPRLMDQIAKAGTDYIDAAEVLNSGGTPVLIKDANGNSVVKRDKDNRIIFEPSGYDRHSGASLGKKPLSDDDVYRYDDLSTKSGAAIFDNMLKIAQEAEAEDIKIK